MTQKGHDGTAIFIRIVHNWFEACDKRGILADECVECLFNMHKFLTKGINFHKTLSKCCSQYIKGMLVQTFEAISQNISVRIVLYSLTRDLVEGTYGWNQWERRSTGSVFSKHVHMATPTQKHSMWSILTLFFFM